MPGRRRNVDTGSGWPHWALAGAALAVAIAYYSLRDWSAAFAFGALAFIVATIPYLRNSWAQAGWHRGYSAAVMAMVEAQRRGLTFAQFMDAELDRVLGRPFSNSDDTHGGATP